MLSNISSAFAHIHRKDNMQLSRLRYVDVHSQYFLWKV